jgi:hypothetical protein
MSEELLPYEAEAPHYIDTCIYVDEWPPFYDTALPIVGLAFVAFCVWFGVRIANRREKPGRKFWASLALLGILLAYPLSMGPVYWVSVPAIPSQLFLRPAPERVLLSPDAVAHARRDRLAAI